VATHQTFKNKNLKLLQLRPERLIGIQNGGADTTSKNTKSRDHKLSKSLLFNRVFLFAVLIISLN